MARMPPSHHLTTRYATLNCYFVVVNCSFEETKAPTLPDNNRERVRIVGRPRGSYRGGGFRLNFALEFGYEVCDGRFLSLSKIKL